MGCELLTLYYHTAGLRLDSYQYAEDSLLPGLIWWAVAPDSGLESPNKMNTNDWETFSVQPIL